MALFQELNEEGVTILIVTHEPDIACYAKRLVEVRDGRILRDEPDAQPPAGRRRPDSAGHGARMRKIDADQGCDRRASSRTRCAPS